MILVGSQRSGASALADHLTNLRDNDHVEILALDGFMADDLHDALQEIQAIAQATQCAQYMFSLSLNPPAEHVVTDDGFHEAADRAGKALGLDGQPRALIIHEKEGRRHAHAVWSRIDANRIRAINLPHFKTRLRDLSRDLFLDHGWELPKGLATHGGKNPLNFTLAEWQQAKRQDIDPREIKQLFRQAWERSDGLKSLRNALEERGYYLAKGDRRGIVAVDVQGEVYALSRWSGEKAKDVRLKCGSGEDLPSVAGVKADLRQSLTSQMKGFIAQVKTKQAQDLEPFYKERQGLVTQHRAERARMKTKQEERWAEETQTRLARLNTGLRGIFDRLTGKRSKIEDRNLREALLARERDRDQMDALILTQMRERQGLQKRVAALRRQHTQDRSILARDVAKALIRVKLIENGPGRSRTQSRFRGSNLSY